jgi:hypothetical protein
VSSTGGEPADDWHGDGADLALTKNNDEPQWGIDIFGEAGGFYPVLMTL